LKLDGVIDRGEEEGYPQRIHYKISLGQQQNALARFCRNNCHYIYISLHNLINCDIMLLQNL